MGRLPAGGFHTAPNSIQDQREPIDMTDFEWRVIKPLLPNEPRSNRCRKPCFTGSSTESAT
jgi:hypothetical protein